MAKVSYQAMLMAQPCCMMCNMLFGMYNSG